MEERLTRQVRARLLSAATFAAERHRDQRRKGEDGIPYVNHCLEVAELLARTGADEETVIAGLLHDTIEDTRTTAAEIEERFGSGVRELVLEVTDDKSLPKPERKRRQVELTPRASRRARRIKIADKICNLRSLLEAPPEEWSRERVLEYFEWARSVVAGARGVCPELEDLFDEIWSGGFSRLGGRD